MWLAFAQLVVQLKDSHLVGNLVIQLVDLFVSP